MRGTDACSVLSNLICKSHKSPNVFAKKAAKLLKEERASERMKQIHTNQDEIDIFFQKRRQVTGDRHSFLCQESPLYKFELYFHCCAFQRGPNYIACSCLLKALSIFIPYNSKKWKLLSICPAAYADNRHKTTTVLEGFMAHFRDSYVGRKFKLSHSSKFKLQKCTSSTYYLQ